MTNKEISNTFSLLGKLMDIHDEHPNNVKAMANAAFAIDKVVSPLESMEHNKIASLRGIGQATSTKIIELLTSGELIELKELIEKTPSGILELLKIKGIGPKKIAVIWKELGIESPGELLYACEENRLIHYKGFGEKSQESIREAIEYYVNNQGRFLFAEIEPIAELILSFLEQLFSKEQVAITGNFRRHCEIIDELEFVITVPMEFILDALSNSQDFNLESEELDELHYTFKDFIKIIFYCCEEEDAGKVLFFTSNTAAFNDAFDELFPETDYEGFHELNDAPIFEQVGLQYVQPFLREHAEIVHLAQQKKIPKLIEPSDIKGVIHSHSTWSDGKNTIEDMAKACIEKGYEYLVMSDHSVSSFYANGLSLERILLQHEEISKLNEQLAPFKIFKSIECDILSDGRLDYSNDVLASFDIVIASVHQNLKMTEEKAMMRLLKAIENPFTKILGHPTGRLLLSRKGYPIDHKKIIDACKEHQVAIELNANPRRLDIDWNWISYAMQQNVMLSINPDAHSVKGIEDIRYGVLVAQKGLLASNQNVSSYNLLQFQEYISQNKLK